MFIYIPTLEYMYIVLGHWPLGEVSSYERGFKWIWYTLAGGERMENP
jgi:hypothetical protein